MGHRFEIYGYCWSSWLHVAHANRVVRLKLHNSSTDFVRLLITTLLQQQASRLGNKSSYQLQTRYRCNTSCDILYAIVRSNKQEILVLYFPAVERQNQL